MDVQSAGAKILAEIEGPGARAFALRVLEALEARLEARTPDPIAREFEQAAFKVVKAHLVAAAS